MSLSASRSVRITAAWRDAPSPKPGAMRHHRSLAREVTVSRCVAVAAFAGANLSRGRLCGARLLAGPRPARPFPRHMPSPRPNSRSARLLKVTETASRVRIAFASACPEPSSSATWRPRSGRPRPEPRRVRHRPTRSLPSNALHTFSIRRGEKQAAHHRSAQAADQESELRGRALRSSEATVCRPPPGTLEFIR